MGAVLWVHDHAAAQVRSASRHEAQDRADERGAIQDRIAALYDPTEMARAMELGTGTLRGTMAVRDKQGVGAAAAPAESRQYARNQVFLFFSAPQKV